MNEAFKVGQTHLKDGTDIRILAVKDNQVLLEQSRNGNIIHYIVTSGLFIHESELHWRGSGAYYPCMYPPPTCDTPVDALSKALDYLRGPKKVYVVISNTDYGMDASLHLTEDNARAALQKTLRDDADVKAAAAKLGIEHLTVDAYFDYTANGELDLFDSYFIVERDIH